MQYLAQPTLKSTAKTWRNAYAVSVSDKCTQDRRFPQPSPELRKCQTMQSIS